MGRKDTNDRLGKIQPYFNRHQYNFTTWNVLNLRKNEGKGRDEMKFTTVKLLFLQFFFNYRGDH